MRSVQILALGLLIAAAGCHAPESGDPASRKRTPPPATAKGGNLAGAPAPAAAPTNAPAATVVLPASGKIHSVNAGLRFVVVDYTLGGAPALQSVLAVYRGGQKVGQIRLSGPERNGFIAADVLEGFLQVEDEVRLQ